MADETRVDIVFAHHYGAHKPGDRITVPEADARALVRAGQANYATKADAKAAEGDAGVEKTATARRSRAQG